MITAIFGQPGAGKTAYLTSLALKYLGNTPEGWTLKKNCIEQVQSFNAQGFNFSVPDRPPVFSNYPISAHVGYKRRRDSYYVDGFRLGHENEFVETIPLPPTSKVFLTEVQRYYNSRKSTELPDWISRYFEEHRHYFLDIYLDLQRLLLLDINIRELATKIIEVAGVKHKTDYIGNVLQSEFTLKLWHDAASAEMHIKDKSLNNYDLVKETFDGNVFDAYKSRSYFDAFLPKEDFMLLEHVGKVVNGVDLSFKKAVYAQSAPYGFYNSEAKKILDERIKEAKEQKKAKKVVA